MKLSALLSTSNPLSSLLSFSDLSASSSNTLLPTSLLRSPRSNGKVRLAQGDDTEGYSEVDGEIISGIEEQEFKVARCEVRIEGM
jgi:hypothetical protein